eukprot:249054-Chlamydomonas_euryale.AAC.5
MCNPHCHCWVLRQSRLCLNFGLHSTQPGDKLHHRPLQRSNALDCLGQLQLQRGVASRGAAAAAGKRARRGLGRLGLSASAQPADACVARLAPTSCPDTLVRALIGAAVAADPAPARHAANGGLVQHHCHRGAAFTMSLPAVLAAAWLEPVQVLGPDD